MTGRTVPAIKGTRPDHVRLRHYASPVPVDLTCRWCGERLVAIGEWEWGFSMASGPDDEWKCRSTRCTGCGQRVDLFDDECACWTDDGWTDEDDLAVSARNASDGARP